MNRQTQKGNLLSGEALRSERDMSDSPCSDVATLLIVDDDSQLRTLCRMCLTAVGFTVLEADDGLGAVLVATTCRGSIDLLISDIQMPHIRGTDLGPIFKALCPGIRLLYISGSADVSIESELGPGDVFLPKPFGLAALVETIRTILSGPLGSQPAALPVHISPGEMARGRS